MSPLAIVVLIVLLDLLGFSIVMPLLAPFADQYGFAAWQIGLLFAAFPLCQLIAGPILGRLSDRHGRRPLLIYSQAGTALSFLILGLSRHYWVMLLARMLDGASGGNILVARAYIADVTKPEDRARGMGLIGMAFGLGFVLGPLLGGLILQVPVHDDWRLRLPFLVAAGFSTVAWVLVLTRLPESVPSGVPVREAARSLSRRGLVDVATMPGVRRLVSIEFLAVLAFACFEGTFALFLLRRFHWDAQSSAFAFAGLGLVSAIVQGGLIRRLVPRFGEGRLILCGLGFVALGFAILALLSSGKQLASGLLCLGVGQGLASPSVSGLLSRTTPPDEQGSVFGVLSSAQTLARLISYAGANALFGLISPTAPYWTAIGVTALALVLATRISTDSARMSPVSSASR
jgi:DHA1 family tetracycline resistance protein-like MFS transporter